MSDTDTEIDQNRNWPIPSANTVTDTETNTESTFQKKNLVTDSMGYFFHHNMVPKTKYAAIY